MVQLCHSDSCSLQGRQPGPAGKPLEAALIARLLMRKGPLRGRFFRWGSRDGKIQVDHDGCGDLACPGTVGLQDGSRDSMFGGDLVQRIPDAGRRAERRETIWDLFHQPATTPTRRSRSTSTSGTPRFDILNFPADSVGRPVLGRDRHRLWHATRRWSRLSGDDLRARPGA